MRLEAGTARNHLTTRVLTERRLWVDFLLLRMCFYLRYQGKGQAPLWLDTLCRVCHGVADVEMRNFMVLRAGLDDHAAQIGVASRMKLAAFAATYAMASFACLARCGQIGPTSVAETSLVPFSALAWSQRVRNDVEVHSPMPVVQAYTQPL